MFGKIQIVHVVLFLVVLGAHNNVSFNLRMDVLLVIKWIVVLSPPGPSSLIPNQVGVPAIIYKLVG